MMNQDQKFEDVVEQISNQMLQMDALQKPLHQSQKSHFLISLRDKIKYEVNTTIISSNPEQEEVRLRTQEFLSLIKEWETHYDFQLWDKVELYFSSVWDDLKRNIHLAMEYDLYLEVRDLFFEIRSVLQWTGRIGERIHIAAWLKRKAEKYDDFSARYIALSSLAWSYTSSGCHQNLDKANSVWKELATDFLETNRPLGFDAFGNDIRADLELPLYSELVMDAHENGVRIEIRNKNLEQAEQIIRNGEIAVGNMLINSIIKPRLHRRYLITFNYHRGIIYYLKHDYCQAEQYFREIIEQADLIKWERVVKAAKSWLATIAVKRKQYGKSERILADIFRNSTHIDKRDAFCHLIKEQLCNDQGDHIQGEVYRIEAHKVFEYYTDNRERYDLNTYSLM